MRAAEYTPADFDALHAAAHALGVASLCHRPFVDHYYAANPWSRLHLLRDDSDAVIGMIGVERMRFLAADGPRDLAFATNFHAARPGVGGLLYLRWLRTCPLGLVFGGSHDTHEILRRQRWTYLPGARTYSLNRRPRVAPGDPLWKRWAKRLLACVPVPGINSRLRLIPRAVRQGLAVHEESHVTEDMTPDHSPFTFRFAPPADHANWRYNTGLPFARYRVFRLRELGRTFGHVVLHDTPGRLIVAHCDGDDASALAYGVLLAVAEAARAAPRREVLLACSHPRMADIYQRFGFRPEGAERPLAVGAIGGHVDVPSDASSWLVNFAWGDNDLRAPFPDARAGDNLTPPNRLAHNVPS